MDAPLRRFDLADVYVFPVGDSDLDRLCQPVAMTTQDFSYVSFPVFLITYRGAVV